MGISLERPIFWTEFSLGQNRMTVSLREVTKEDLPIFFEHQLDAEATRMAAFPSRDRDAFMAHWARIMSKETNETGILNTILLADGTVAGNVVYWEAAGEPNIAYWLRKKHLGKRDSGCGPPPCSAQREERTV